MNGKYMGWREQRWERRQPQRLAHIAQKREEKNGAAKQRPERSETHEHRQTL